MLLKGFIAAGLVLVGAGITIYELTGGGLAFIAGIFAILIIGWIGFSFYLSRRADPRLSGSGFIIRAIEKYGEDPKRVPISLLDQEVEEAITMANIKNGATWENNASRARWNPIFIEELDTRAMMISYYLSNPQHEFFRPADNGENYFVAKFTKHGL